MKYTSRADLLIAAGESIKMQTAAGIEPMQKYGGSIMPIIVDGEFHIGDTIELNEFPLAVVEGNPVFVGDELYDEKGGIWIADNENFATNKPDKSLWFGYEHMSWNPPKPKTLMVELPITVVEWYAKHMFGELTEPCRKALEKA